jgi:ATP-dependent Clp protease ATP-binding subunit ClpA
MFERFTRDAREVVVGAQEECRRLGDGHIDTVHLLLSLAARGNGPGGGALREHGMTLDDLRDRARRRTGLGAESLDGEALATLGIDLAAVREVAEAAFGSGALEHGRASRGGHIPFSPQAKKTLELSLREAIALKQRSIDDGHILLGLLRATGRDNAALRVLDDAGVDASALRATVTRLAGAA